MGGMLINRICSIAVVVLLLFILGCDRKPATEAKDSASIASQRAISTNNLIARFHWIGKNRLAMETNAARFMSIWNMPESVALENQTLNKLALSPWRLTRGDAATNGAPTLQMRGLLDDLVHTEWYAEVHRRETKQTAEVVLAMRLNAERHSQWKDNLAAVAESLTGFKVENDQAGGGWVLRKHDAPNLLQIERAGDWTLVGLAHEQNTLLGDFGARIKRDHTPFAAPATNYWLDADMDLVQLNEALALGWKLPAGFPRIKLTEIGDGENVRIWGELVFREPLDMKIEPWNIPTNLIREPLLSFTAVRGVEGIFSNYAASWFGNEQVPNQAFSWGRSGPPLQMYMAVSTDDVKASYAHLENKIITSVAPFIDSKKFGTITRRLGTNRMLWDGLFFGVPGISIVTNQTKEFLLLSFAPFFAPKSTTTNQIPPALAHRVCDPEDLLFFNWEQTGERLAQWRYCDDASRIIFDAAHRPRLNRYMPAIEWAAMGITNLDHSVTDARLTRQNQLTFTRKATVGLTALELDLLLNWLELVDFPRGFSSIFATNATPAPVRRKVGPQPPTPSR